MKTNDYTLPIEVVGHVKITDDLGTVLLDKRNSVHPQNLARVFARALAHEDNYYINRVAFGNGGTIVDAAYQITYKTPNDGQAPDTSEWKSRLYNETYTEIIDESNINIGSGAGASPTNDPVHSTSSGPGVRSEESGLVSKVTIEVVLNPYEPTGQSSTDLLYPNEATEDAFVFDEIGLFAPGAPHTDTAAYQDVDINTKLDMDITGLAQTTVYQFSIVVDGGTQQDITFNTGVGSGVGGQIQYSDLVAILNASVNGCTAKISNEAGTVNTFGKLRFISNTSGVGSTISIVVPSTLPANWLFSNLTGYTGVLLTQPGQAEGNKNNPTEPAKEGERLLTHLIFSPVRKSANRTLSVVYTLTIQVARSS
jgi:hypothetical protein